MSFFLLLFFLFFFFLGFFIDSSDSSSDCASLGEVSSLYSECFDTGVSIFLNCSAS